MKDKHRHKREANVTFVLVAVLILTLVGCGTGKNTWLSRNYHAMTTRYNVGFNGKESYKEGLELLYKGTKDDFTKIIPLYPIGNHADTTLALTQMNRAIEKASKAEKLHSIRKKPKKNQARKDDPKYRAWMKKEEYNREMSRVWLLHGKAQLHKGDFLGAVGTFTYVTKHFTTEPKRVTEANIWLARAYMEMGWTYDADDVMTKLERMTIPKKLSSDYAGAQAYLHLLNKENKKAIEPLTSSISDERNKRQKARSYYVLASLLHGDGNDEGAKAYYRKAYRHSSNFDMTFNSKVGYAVADYQNTAKAVKRLDRMARDERYKDGLDKIYGAMGDIYLAAGDKEKAIDSYKTAIGKSTQNGADKVKALVSLADLLYNSSRYIEAQPLYSEATGLMAATDDDYVRVAMRSQVLGELAQNNDVVVTQDSMQRLASMSESDRNAAIKAHIEKLKKEEAEARAKAEAETRMSMYDTDKASPGGVMMNRGQNGSKAWYFYNPQLISQGRNEFQKKWGTRKLEDNWRLTNKQSVNMEYGDDEEPESAMEDTGQNEAEENVTSGGSNVNGSVEYYVGQLPLTPNQVEKSNEQISDALYNMGEIYQSKLEDLPMAIKTFEELERRFPRHRKLPDAYFLLYQMNEKKGDESSAGWYRRQLINKYPESSYAQVLRDPNYKENILRLTATQDSLYQSTYFAYTRNNFDTVAVNYKYLKEKFPLSPLMPKMTFVNALSEGKQGNNDNFEKGMEELVTKYPESDVSAMAKSMLALYRSGRRVESGSTHGSILALRDSMSASTEVATDTLRFSSERRDVHNVMLLTDGRIDVNKLLFAVASYNFTGFLVKDFDLSRERNEDGGEIVMISQLDDLDETFWYMANLEHDRLLGEYLNSDSCRAVAISRTNLGLLRNGLKLKDYLLFYNDSILPQRKAEKIDFASAEAQRRSLIDAAVAAEKIRKQTDEKAEQDTLEREMREAEEELARQNEEIRRQRDKRLKARDRESGIRTENAKDSKGTEKTEAEKNEQTKQTDEIKTTGETGKYKEDLMATHEYAIMVNGKADVNKVRLSIEKYNLGHYPNAPLSVETYNMGGKSLISVRTFATAFETKNYMFGMLRERQIFQPLRGVNYQSVVISTDNREELVRTGDFDGYEKFNRDHYLK